MEIINCFKCKYIWECESKMWLVSCPNCGSKNKTSSYGKEIKEA